MKKNHCISSLWTNKNKAEAEADGEAKDELEAARAKEHGGSEDRTDQDARRGKVRMMPWN